MSALAGRRSVRAIALIEAVKGALVLLAGFGLLALVHRDVAALGDALVHHLHLNPARHLPRIFLDALRQVDDHRLRLLALGAAAYSALRLAEAWGLWRERAWAEWLGVLSGAIYLPFEIRTLWHHPTLLKAVTFGVNVLVVWVLARALAARRR